MSVFDSPLVAAFVTVTGSYWLTQHGVKESRKERDRVKKLEEKVKELEK